MVKGGLNHESHEVFHGSRKFFEGFHGSRKFFEGFHVSRKISARWTDYRASGKICNDRRVQGSTLVGVQGVKPTETPEILHFRGTK